MIRQTLLASAIAVAFSGPAFAQDSTTKTQMETTDVAALQSGYQVRASDLLGIEIENTQEENIGELDDLTISGDDMVLHAVVSVGGFLGIGDKLVAVPYNELQISRNQDDDVVVVYDATKEQLESQPEFKYREGDTVGRERMRSRMSESTDQSQDTPLSVTGDKPKGETTPESN
jgi:sporulation protein YlmC with PRC-barrel domain